MVFHVLFYSCPGTVMLKPNQHGVWVVSARQTDKQNNCIVKRSLLHSLIHTLYSQCTIVHCVNNVFIFITYNKLYLIKIYIDFNNDLKIEWEHNRQRDHDKRETV